MLANKLWDDAGLSFPAKLCGELTIDVEHPVECIQSATAEALAALLTDNRSQVQSILESLIKIYKDKLAVCSK